MQNIDILFRLNCFPTFHAQSDVLKWSATIILHFTSLISWYHRGIIKDMATTFLSHPLLSATLPDPCLSNPVCYSIIFHSVFLGLRFKVLLLFQFIQYSNVSLWHWCFDHELLHATDLTIFHCKSRLII